MTQLLREPGNISNHFDELFNGIGHRGSSFTNIDGLIHNGKKNKFLMLEFKHWGESVSTGQRWAMSDFAKLLNCDAWIIHWRDDVYQLEILPNRGVSQLRRDQLQDALAAWWG